MGLAGYYRIFIKGFTKIGCPITALQKKGDKFTWTQECEEIFQTLKHLLTHAPILKIADPEADFLMCTNACKEGLRGVLMQEGSVVCYESRTFSEHEVNYVTHDLELAAIVHALKMWRYYLLGRKFVLMTDHCGLRYLFDQPKLNSRQARWMTLLSEFDFEIKHIKGKENKVVDALSKKYENNSPGSSEHLRDECQRKSWECTRNKHILLDRDLVPGTRTRRDKVRRLSNDRWRFVNLQKQIVYSRL
jgi:hypothetical protein